MSWLKRLLLAPVALILIFEEWGWIPLQKAFKWLKALPLWNAMEAKIQSLPPYGALACFFIPGALLFPIKLLGLYLLSHGQVLGATLLLVAAKVVGTALVARMFTLVEPQLMQLWWFAKYYPRWKNWKDNLIEKVRTSWTWRAARWMKKKLWREMKIQYKKFSFWKTN